MPRNKKNPKLLKAEGTYKREPGKLIESIEASEGRPPTPPAVSACPIAHEIWIETLDFMEDLGILTFADEHILVLYCTTYAELIKLTKEVQESGHTVVDERGNFKPHPVSIAWDRAKASYIKVAGQLGLTPAARAGIPAYKDKGKVEKKSASDELMAELGI